MLLIAISATSAFAQGRARRQPQAPGAHHPQPHQQATPSQSALRLLNADAVAQHAIETAWGKVDDTAAAGTLALFDQSGERAAAVFSTGYVAKVADPAKRAITFVFNGGPGAAS